MPVIALRLKAIYRPRVAGLLASLPAVALLALPAVGQDAPAGPPPTPVLAAPVKLRDVQEHRKVTGDLRAQMRSKVATIEPGLVIECPVREGDMVSKGDVLARLDDRRLVLEFQRIDAQIASAAAIIAERAAQLEQKQRDYDALRELSERSASNPKELADAESDLHIAAARKDQAQLAAEVLNAQAQLLRTRLADKVIRAAFDGVIIAKNTEVGQWVATGDALVEIVSIGAFDAWLNVPQQYAPVLMQGDAHISIEIPALRERYEPGKPRIIRQVDQIARTFAAVVEVADPQGRLAPGMSVIGWAPTGQQGRHLMVSRDALLKNAAGFFVYVVAQKPGNPSQAVPKQVEILFEHEGDVAVRTGSLQDGDLVVTEGNERLFPMMPISFEVVGDTSHDEAGIDDEDEQQTSGAGVSE